MVAMIKYAVIILCSTYTTRKILHMTKRLSSLKELLLLLFLLGTGWLVCLLRQYFPSVSLLAMVILSIGIHICFFQLKPSASIVATIISYGITYLEYLGSVLILIVLDQLFSAVHTAPEIVQVSIIALIQISLAFLLFRVRRFSHGLPFLDDSKYGDLGVYLSTSVLMAASFLGMNLPQHYITAVIAYTLFILGMILWFWYKSRITQEYWNQMREREQTALQEQIAVLRKENEALSAIIHKDNKLIPALDLSVKAFLSSAAQNDCREERIQSAQAIIAQIERVSSERAGTVRSYEQASTLSIQTGSSAIDALLSFMAHKARLAMVEIVFSICNNIEEMLATAVSEQDMATLLADLIDNAIIAVKQVDQEKRICVEIGRDAFCGAFFIQVSDSGIPFSREVLDKLGTQRITTHKDSGGSGIGMMTICSICRKYKASFSIVPCLDNTPYTKSIKICFNHKSDFLV